MIPSPSEIQYFLEVAQTLNISRASERLGISQPTLSLAIQRLERSLGTNLLIRSKAGVKLTQAGSKLANHARALLEDWDKLRAEAVRDDNEIRGRYVLGCHPSVALYSLPLILGKIQLDNPHLDIVLVHDLSRKITEDIISFKVDFGFVVNPWNHPDLVIQSIWTDEVTFWTTAHPSPLQTPGHEASVLFCDPALMQSQSLLKQMQKKGIEFRRVVTSSSLEVIAALVAAKAGVGILPGRVANRVPSYGLKKLSKSAPSFDDKISLVYRADAQRSKASRKLARLLVDTLNTGSA